MLPALLATSAIGALGNFFGSRSAAKSQERQNAENLAFQRETNAQNLQMFHDARGASGSAILPEYLKDYESGLGARASETARSLFDFGGSAQTRLGRANDMLQRYNPAIDAGDNTLIDLSTGRIGEGRRAGLEPVLQARTKLARTRAAAINQGLDETLAGIRSMRAGAGFRGMSTFDNNRTLAATAGARAGAAGAIGQADLDNALAVQGMDESNLQLLLSSLDMPFQRGQQRLAFNNLPVSMTAAGYNDAMAPLNFFRLPAATNLPYQSAPQFQAGTSTGQLVGSGIAGLSQGLGQYLAQQQMMKDMASYFQPQSTRGGYDVPLGSS